MNNFSGIFSSLAAKSPTDFEFTSFELSKLMEII